MMLIRATRRNDPGRSTSAVPSQLLPTKTNGRVPLVPFWYVGAACAGAVTPTTATAAARSGTSRRTRARRARDTEGPPGSRTCSRVQRGRRAEVTDRSGSGELVDELAQLSQVAALGDREDLCERVDRRVAGVPHQPRLGIDQPRVLGGVDHRAQVRQPEVAVVA